MRDRVKSIRCAIYTRKSSEEGLEQDFNSLHAQREACEAYVTSQKHEGWTLLPAPYDDGGYSGGSMERPALQRLLADIASGTIDIVVVYKVDRLTRALTDFARMVDVFDEHGASFVSVTQAFNTTTSMGRLTLNVLLSFAQFEREVTGERIRDKIAASKKKGMWMGGSVPLGYQAKDRTLVIDEAEAGMIRTIYSLYLELQSVDALKEEADRRGFRTRHRPEAAGHMIGGTLFGRGHLYRILSNPLYAGKIAHKDEIYDGQHPAIIDQATFDAVQSVLSTNSYRHRAKANSKNPSLLGGLIVDDQGEPLVATHAVKQGARYRYYVSRSALKTRPRGRPPAEKADSRPDGASPWRLPAGEIEGAVLRILVTAFEDKHWLSDEVVGRNGSSSDHQRTFDRAQELARLLQNTDPIAKRGLILTIIQRVRIAKDSIEITLTPECFAPAASASDRTSDRYSPDEDAIRIARPLTLRHRGSEARIVIDGEGPADPEPDPALIKALAQAHRWWSDLTKRRYKTLRDIAAAYDTDERYAAWVLRLAFLSPDLTRAILDGTQPVEFTLHEFLRIRDFPMRWQDQNIAAAKA